MKSKDFMTAYMNKKFNYGGVMTKRADIIRDLQKITKDQKLISIYMIGLERGERKC